MSDHSLGRLHVPVYSIIHIPLNIPIFKIIRSVIDVMVLFALPRFIAMRSASVHRHALLCSPQVIHCRWAMLGAAGCIAPEVLAQFQPGFPEANNVAWFSSGVIPPAGAYKGYWTDSVSLFFIEAIAMNFAELKRLQDFKYGHGIDDGILGTCFISVL